MTAVERDLMEQQEAAVAQLRGMLEQLQAEDVSEITSQDLRVGNQIKALNFLVEKIWAMDEQLGLVRAAEAQVRGLRT